MRIEIDTKEDLHNIKHIMRLLQAISSGVSHSRYDESLFSETSSPSSPSPTPETPSSLFNMFDSPSSSSSSESSNLGLPGIFDEKKNDDKKDFLDSLQVY